MSFTPCEHFAQRGEEVELTSLDATEGCFECLKTGDTWVNLRQCMTDGKVRCCDSSPNKHATAHYNESGHPVIYMLENLLQWCYIDESLDQDI
jgi:uncharacterized UBP type Zn finger protein